MCNVLKDFKANVVTCIQISCRQAKPWGKVVLLLPVIDRTMYILPYLYSVVSARTRKQYHF
jgi:hypothetical protein